MNIKIERIYLRKLPFQFKEFYNTTNKEQKRLEPWFWWVNISPLYKFYFISFDAFFNKLSKFVPGLPCNKKFIIRVDNKFAGIVGLDHIYRGAPKIELWLFLTTENEHQGIATEAVEWATKYATQLSCKKICARTIWNNIRARGPLIKNDFEIIERTYWNDEHILWWEKVLDNNKVIEK